MVTDDAKWTKLHKLQTYPGEYTAKYTFFIHNLRNMKRNRLMSFSVSLHMRPPYCAQIFHAPKHVLDAIFAKIEILEGLTATFLRSNLRAS